jgi:hypothetical protein
VIIGGEAVSDFDLFDENLRAAFAPHTFGAAVNCRIVIRPHTFEDWARGASAAGIRSIASEHQRRAGRHAGRDGGVGTLPPTPPRPPMEASPAERPELSSASKTRGIDRSRSQGRRRTTNQSGSGRLGVWSNRNRGGDGAHRPE